MRNKYGLLIIILIFLLTGLGLNILNKYYTVGYIYNLLFKREFAVNPRVEIDPKKKYIVRIWYYPIYRTTEMAGREKLYFREIARGIQEKYPNIYLKIRELNFLDGHQEMLESIKKGEPPDIYMNISGDSLLDQELQLPVDPYIVDQQEGFLTVNWQEINRDNHLWSLPFFIQKQYWVTNQDSNVLQSNSGFIESISTLDRARLALNIADETLLRQLLTLKGLRGISLEGGDIDENTYKKLKEVYEVLHSLREKGVFVSLSRNMDDNFMKDFFTKKPVFVGPVNPYLACFLSKDINYHRIMLDNLIKEYSLTILRQRDYQGHDHSKAVMLTALYMATSGTEMITGILPLEAAYQRDSIKKKEYVKLLEIKPEDREYWRGVIIPAWRDFWEKDLSPAKVMEKIK